MAEFNGSDKDTKLALERIIRAHDGMIPVDNYPALEIVAGAYAPSYMNIWGALEDAGDFIMGTRKNGRNTLDTIALIPGDTNKEAAIFTLRNRPEVYYASRATLTPRGQEAWRIWLLGTKNL